MGGVVVFVSLGASAVAGTNQASLVHGRGKKEADYLDGDGDEEIYAGKQVHARVSSRL